MMLDRVHTVGIYDVKTNSTIIYVYWRDSDFKLWATTPEHKKVEIPEQAEMPCYTRVPGKLEME